MLIKNVPIVVSAACVLHNMCEIHGETFDESWVNDESSDLAQPDRRSASSTYVAGSVLREALLDYFNR